MAIALGVFILVGGFIALFKLFRLTEAAKNTMAAAQEALAVMQDATKDDDEKEVAMQALAKKLFGYFIILTAGSIAALGIPAGLVWGLDRLQLIPFQAVIDFTISWEFLIGTTVVLFLIGMFKGRKKDDGFEIRYSYGERALHQVAFSTTLMQLSVAGMEDSLFAKRIAAARNSHPVFVTGLPRGGTTLLLNILYSLGEFASHRYRDMPFLLTPLLWSKFTRIFQAKDEMRERAHGDGMMVSVDSPEALEEMVWKPFWGKQYQSDRITPWPATPDESFNDFFDSHMAKIIAIKQKDQAGCRYVSKNNLNISRIDYLLENNPDATVIVPFRHPVRHAQSLLKQHLNFLDIHARDPFARIYMEGVGHYDFGENIRPIDFNGWFDSRRFKDFTDINFWLEYWTVAYEHLLSKAGDRVHLHSHERLCERPAEVLATIGDILGVADRDTLLKNEDTVWRGQESELNTEGIDPDLLRRSEELWDRLRKASLA